MPPLAAAALEAIPATSEAASVTVALLATAAPGRNSSNQRGRSREGGARCGPRSRRRPGDERCRGRSRAAAGNCRPGSGSRNNARRDLAKRGTVGGRRAGRCSGDERCRIGDSWPRWLALPRSLPRQRARLRQQAWPLAAGAVASISTHETLATDRRKRLDLDPRDLG